MNRNATVDVVYLRDDPFAGRLCARALEVVPIPVGLARPAADITVEHIGELLGVDDNAWLDRRVSPASTAGRAQSESLSPRADGGA